MKNQATIQCVLMILAAADGTCLIEPALSPRKVSAIGSDLDIALGAVRVLRGCVQATPEHFGGYALDLSELR